MDLDVGGNRFVDVKVPVLWGKRAILQDEDGRISVINLGGSKAKAEIVGDEPAPDVEYSPMVDGFKILRDGETQYAYYKQQKSFVSLSLDLPDVHISQREIRVGQRSVIERSMFRGFDVGVHVSDEGIALGKSMPDGLAKLKL